MGEYIIRANEPVKWFYILLSGSAKLVYESPKGEALILDIYHAGDFFGEMEMVDLQTVDRAIIAMTPCEAYRFSRRQFFDLWDGASSFSRLLLTVHSDRLLRAGDDKIYERFPIASKKLFKGNFADSGECVVVTVI